MKVRGKLLRVAEMVPSYLNNAGVANLVDCNSDWNISSPES
jgi:hypothetical protein